MKRTSALRLAAAATGTALAATQTAVAAADPESMFTQARRTSYIERMDGTTLFYQDWGAGRPLLFVHGADIDSGAWSYQMVPLAAHGFRCIAYDRRGHGRSSDLGRDDNFDTLADDLASVMELLDLRNVTIVAHTMGCAEVARYFTRHGAGRASRVVMIAPTMPEADFRAELPQITVPTLVLHPSKDVSRELLRFAWE
jgi:non-heme chloroperoxidase